MTQLDDQEAEFSKLIAGIPVDDAPNPVHADALREQVLARLCLNEPIGDQRVKPKPIAAIFRFCQNGIRIGREIMRRPLYRNMVFVTTAAVIAAVWLFVPGHQSTAMAFNNLSRVVATAKSARYKIEVEGQLPQTGQCYFLAPGKYRSELPMMTTISDNAAGKTVSLNPATKIATVMNIKGQPEDKKPRDTFGRLRQLLADKQDGKEGQYESLGEHQIDGKLAAGYRLETPGETVTMWGDPQTGNPIRIEFVVKFTPSSKMVMTQFEINVDLDESLFNLTPPADYKIQSFDFDASKTGEEDLIHTLKVASKASWSNWKPSFRIRKTIPVIKSSG